MPFAGNLRTLPLPDVFQTLNNIKATGVLRLRSNAGSRDVVFQQGEIIGVGFLDKAGREDLELRLTLLGIDPEQGERMKGVTWYWTAMQAREHTARAELDELVHEQAREQLHNLFAWNQAEFAFDEAGPGKTIANELVARSLERPLSIDTATILLEAAKQQDEWAELRSRIRDEAGVAAMGSSPTLPMQEQFVDPAKTADGFESHYHLYLDGEWRGPYPRAQIVGLVQTGDIASETWSYDPLTQERRTLDELLGDEAHRITPDELDTLRQAVKAAENRLGEERSGRSADLAELRGLASEVLRLAHDCQLQDPAITAVVERLAEVVNGDDPSIVALAAETVIVAVVRHLREIGERSLAEARGRADELAIRIAGLEQAAGEERSRLEAQLAEAENRTDAEREAAAGLRQRLAQAAEDAAHLNQELERSRRDHSRASTARLTAIRSPEDVTRAPALERELGRMRAEHARLLSEVANLQARIDEDRARHQSELEATRALAGSVARVSDPPTETIGRKTETIGRAGESAEHKTETIGTDTERIGRPATETLHRPTPAPDASLIAEIDELKTRLAEAERRGGGSGLRRAQAEHERVAAERDQALAEAESLRHELQRVRDEGAQAGNRAAEQALARIQAAEQRAAQAEARLATSETLLRSAEEALAEARARAERAEATLREREREAYEAARANTQMQVRVRELATRLEDGEARLAELGDLSSQLAEAQARAASLEEEGARFRADLAAVRDAATGRLERGRRRIAELRARLREAKRDRNAPVPWSSPMTAAFTAAPALPQAPVPWPSPATAAYAAAPAQPQAPVPWPSPATAAFAPQALQPTTSVGFAPAGPALAPTGGELPNATLRTTSGTFVPMPMPEESSAGRPRVAMPPTAQPVPALPAAAPSRRRLAWGGAAAAALALAAGGVWLGAGAALPICDRAIVNGALREVSGRIAGQLQLAEAVREGSWIAAGSPIGVLRNSELDPYVLGGLQDRLRQSQARILAAESTQRQVQAQLDQVTRRLADEPASPEAPALARLRDEFALRLAELGGTIDDHRARRGELERDIAAEEKRLADLREAPLSSPVDGVVWSIASTGEAHPAGKPLVTIIDASSLVIDAEIPDGQRIAVGDPAQVQLGGGTFRAQVSALDATTRLAKSLPTSPGARRVLLTVENPRILDRELARSARIAFIGPDPGLFAWLGMRLRF